MITTNRFRRARFIRVSAADLPVLLPQAGAITVMRKKGYGSKDQSDIVLGSFQVLLNLLYQFRMQFVLLGLAYRQDR